MSLRYLSMSQLSEVAGIDRRTVKDRLANVKPFKKEGKAIIFDATVALPVLFGYSAGNENVLEQIKEQTLRLEKAKADKIELELEERRGQVVAIEDVAKAVEKEYTYVRSTILSIPSKRAKVLALESDPQVVRSLLEQDINEALSHLQADTNLEFKDEEEVIEETP